jgi:L-iditol 2-dehydrogenase
VLFRSITEVGREVQGWKTGDRVTVDSRAGSCGLCSFCRSGRTNLCPQRVGYGSNKDGGFASFVAVHQDSLHRLPDHISFREGALCEPMACTVHAVMEISSLKPGAVALVTGPGPIGLLTLQVAKAKGGIVVITGRKRDEERLQLARQLGAEECVQVEDQELAPVIAKLTDGHGVDVAFECSGAAGGLNDCLQSVQKAGEIIQIGLSGHPASGLNLDDIALKEIRIQGTFGHNRGSWEKTIDLLEKRKVDLAPLVSGEFPLDQWLKPFKLFEEGQGLKYLLYPIA